MEDRCSICLESLSNGCDLTSLKCNHNFHKDCVESWLVKKGTCPYCRFQEREPNEMIDDYQYDFRFDSFDELFDFEEHSSENIHQFHNNNSYDYNNSPNYSDSSYVCNNSSYIFTFNDSSSYNVYYNYPVFTSAVSVTFFNHSPFVPFNVQQHTQTIDREPEVKNQSITLENSSQIQTYITCSSRSSCSSCSSSTKTSQKSIKRNHKNFIKRQTSKMWNKNYTKNDTKKLLRHTKGHNHRQSRTSCKRNTKCK